MTLIRLSAGPSSVNPLTHQHLCVLLSYYCAQVQHSKSYNTQKLKTLKYTIITSFPDGLSGVQSRRRWIWILNQDFLLTKFNTWWTLIMYFWKFNFWCQRELVGSDRKFGRTARVESVIMDAWTSVRCSSTSWRTCLTSHGWPCIFLID